jgi:hypothetical protein
LAHGTYCNGKLICDRLRCMDTDADIVSDTTWGCCDMEIFKNFKIRAQLYTIFILLYNNIKHKILKS